MKKHRIISTLLVFFIIACSAVFALAGAPDYAQKESWLALPDQASLEVDVFWVYPTVYHSEPLIADLHNQEMVKGAKGTLISQASVFKGKANLFAPLYRQASMKVLGMSADQREERLKVGGGDVARAFDYYMKHFNKGRPFFLAGHSQGSNQLVNLLLKKAGGPDLKNMIAAYTIGWSVTKDDLDAHPALKMCARADQTGCIVSYNSIAKGRQKAAPTIMHGAVSVNPLSWSLLGDIAPASLNLGAVFFDENGAKIKRPHFTPARNRDGGLEVEPADPSLTPDRGMGKGIYHAYDYSLFYENLRRNIARRIDSFRH